MIKIITKDYCPFCELAKELISSIGYDYEEIDVTNDYEMLKQAMEASQIMTVPQIFKSKIKLEDFLGDYSKIKELHEKGELINKLK